MEIKYTQEQVQKILEILDSIEVKGLINMQKIIGVINILNEPFQNNKKEVKNNK